MVRRNIIKTIPSGQREKYFALYREQPSTERGSFFLESGIEIVQRELFVLEASKIFSSTQSNRI